MVQSSPDNLHRKVRYFYKDGCQLIKSQCITSQLYLKLEVSLTFLSEINPGSYQMNTDWINISGIICVLIKSLRAMMQVKMWNSICQKCAEIKWSYYFKNDICCKKTEWEVSRRKGNSSL